MRAGSRDAIERHEDVAAWAVSAVTLLALVSAVVFVRGGGLDVLRRRSSTRQVSTLGVAVVLATAAAASAILGYTGKLGGRIAHVEFASGAGQDASERSDDSGRRRRRRGGD